MNVTKLLGVMLMQTAKQTIPRGRTEAKATTPFTITGTMLLMVAAPGTASAVPIRSTLRPTVTGTTLTEHASSRRGSCSGTYSSCNRICSLADAIAGTWRVVAAGLAFGGASPRSGFGAV